MHTDSALLIAIAGFKTVCEYFVMTDYTNEHS